MSGTGAATRAAVGAGRAVTRGAGLATAPLRPGPDFLVIGAKRGGTTSLHATLSRHPHVLPLFPSGRTPLKRTDTKGLHHFVPAPVRSDAWYRSHFPTRLTRAAAQRRLGGPVVAGEASPYYLFHPQAAARARAAYPHVKVVALLRDPVERTHSHYREQRRNGVEQLGFAEALAAEAERTAGAQALLERDPGAVSWPHEHQSYRAQSEYATALGRWLDAFGAAQVLVLPSELFYADPQQAYDRVVAFLGLPPHRLEGETVLNAAPRADLDPGLRAGLRAHFAPDVARLEERLGASMGWPGVGEG